MDDALLAIGIGIVVVGVIVSIIATGAILEYQSFFRHAQQILTSNSSKGIRGGAEFVYRGYGDYYSRRNNDDVWGS